MSFAVHTLSTLLSMQAVEEHKPKVSVPRACLRSHSRIRLAEQHPRRHRKFHGYPTFLFFELVSSLRY